MTTKRFFGVVAALVLAFSTAGAAQAANPYIIVGNADSLPASLANDVAANGGVLTGSLPQIGVAFAESSNPKFISKMGRVSGIQGVIPDELFVYDAPTVEIGPQYHGTLPGAGFFDDLTWGIDAVGAPAAWAAGNTGEGVRVAVLDSGIDIGHPDLAAHINHGLSTSFMPCVFGMNCDGAFEDWRVRPGFFFNHGTHVAGTIAGTGDLGVTGVAPDAELVIVKVCTEYDTFCSSSGILNGIVYAASIDADLVNMSLGGLRRMRNDFVKYCKDVLGLPANECGHLAKYNAQFQDDYVHSSILIYKRAFEYARSQGTTVIVANGNNGINADTAKDIKLGFADFPHTIGVSALAPLGWCLDPSTSVDEMAHYSNYGQSVTDFSGPGGDWDGANMDSPYTDLCAAGPSVNPAWVFDMVFSTIPGGWSWAAGTSMATPHVTGIAALLISANGGPMSPSAVEQALKGTAHDLGKPGKDAIHGHGRVHSGY